MIRNNAIRGLLLACTTMAVSLAVAVPAWSAEPQGPFAIFKQCPRFTTGVNFCLYAQIEGGEVSIGSSSVPINEDKKHEIVLQGGYERNEEGEERFFGALNGETLSKTPQNVPGGLTGLIKCTEITGSGLLEVLARTACKTALESGATGVTATTELAAPASDIGISTDNDINEEGVALSLPIKIHLENPFLGSECYLGSNADPIILNLTTGTTSPPKPNEPISGKFGHFKTNEFEGLTFTELTEATLVDNTFSVPSATGCGGLLAVVVNPLVNTKLGLPSESGHNTAIQDGKQRFTLAEHVIRSEK